MIASNVRATVTIALLSGAAAGQVLQAVPPQSTATLTWRPLPALMERTHHAIAYDPRRDRAVLFGGLGEYVFGDTWEWDGTTWEHRRTEKAPAPRWGHAMAYDPVRETVLLFGGWDRNGEFGDTWEWDGREWRDLHPHTAPSSRGFAAIATDVARKRLVLFGGAPKGFLVPARGDTWEWDGMTWRQRQPATRPLARAEASMAYDATAQTIVMFGGANFGILPNPKTWLWNGHDWTALSPSPSPSRRVRAGSATDPATGRVVLHGGEGEPARNYLNDTWVWDGALWLYVSPLSRPAVRPSAVLFPDATRTRMFGGGRVSGTPPGPKRGTWSWDGVAWTKVHDVPRPGGVLHAVHDPARDEVLLVGNTGILPWTADAWVLRGDTYVPVAAPNPAMVLGPMHLAYHAPSTEVLCIWNGELWVWDGQTWRFDSKAPSTFWRECPAYDTQRWRWVFIDLLNQDVWEWDGQQWSRTMYSGGPPLRQGYALGYDPTRRRIALFGGASPGANDDMWEWDGFRWHCIHPQNRPPSRTGAHLLHIPALGGLLLFGGTGTPPPTENWLWDGSDWTRIEGLAGPVAADRVLGAAYDAGRQRLVAFVNFLENRALAPQDWELDLDTLHPFRQYPRPGESLDLDVRLPQQAGNPVALFLAESSRPGIPLRVLPGVGTELLPLAPGPLLTASAQIGLMRRLDSRGRATFTLPIPNVPSLHWFSFHAAGVALQGPSVGAITNGVPLQVVK